MLRPPESPWHWTDTLHEGVPTWYSFNSWADWSNADYLSCSWIQHTDLAGVRTVESHIQKPHDQYTPKDIVMARLERKEICESPCLKERYHVLGYSYICWKIITGIDNFRRMAVYIGLPELMGGFRKWLDWYDIVQNTRHFQLYHKHERNLCNHFICASYLQPPICSIAGIYSHRLRHCNTCKFVTNCSTTYKRS